MFLFLPTKLKIMNNKVMVYYIRAKDVYLRKRWQVTNVSQFLLPIELQLSSINPHTSLKRQLFFRALHFLVFDILEY